MVKAGYVKEFKDAVQKIIEPTREEEGNIQYVVMQVVDEVGKETNRFEFFELWKNKNAMMKEHLENTQHMREFF